VSIDIWTKCDGVNQVKIIDVSAWRLESQEGTSTRKLVDSYEEQNILEKMIDDSRYLFINEEKLNFHPLLYTPFKDPPLKYGSRFGKNTEQSLWYGSLDLATAMAEKAFYQFNFLRASEAKYDDIVQTSLIAFSVQVKTEKGIDLCANPFAVYTDFISSPDSYDASQALGSAMRKANIQAFIYKSARDKKDGANVALFTPESFLHKKPEAASFQSWLCVATNELIEFISTSSNSLNRNSFNLNQFMIYGILPFPSN